MELLEKLEKRKRQRRRLLTRYFCILYWRSSGRKERQLIYLRYFENKTQSETGKQLGMSQVQVSRLEKKILKRMKEYGGSSVP